MVYPAVLCWLALVLPIFGYVDFGDLTRPITTAFSSVPRPHQLPAGWTTQQQKLPQYPMITAVAPFVTMCEDGNNTISWSTTYHKYSRHFQNARGIFKRQNGVFQSEASLLATCTPCANGSSSQSSSNLCYASTYTGVLAGSVASYSGTVCYGTGYSGVIQPASTSTGLPCCPSCTPVQNATGPITTGVLVTSASAPNATAPSTVSSTTTVIVHTSTTTPIIISVSTITPTSPLVSESPVITTAPGTIIGCGTASGSGTVVGSGTVFLGPGGIFPVTSSGTVSGFASKVIGCGTIIATSGSFSGTARITGCGTGSGCAILTGSGKVYPDALGGLIGITSSGTVSGCGRVVGCGTLTGSGIFLISGPYTSTITPARPRSTVNVYISYCSPTPTGPFRIAGNFTDLATSQPSAAAPPDPYPGYNNTSAYPLPPLSSLHTHSNNDNNTLPLNTGNLTSNSTNTTIPTSDNPLCQICPNSSGICCPLYVACGADGHCPYTALQGAGYVLFGVNLVDVSNSSERLGMVPVQGRIPPGLPESDDDGAGELGSGGNVRRGWGWRGGKKGVGRRNGHGHGHGLRRR